MWKLWRQRQRKKVLDAVEPILPARWSDVWLACKMRLKPLRSILAELKREGILDNYIDASGCEIWMRSVKPRT